MVIPTADLKKPTFTILPLKDKRKEEKVGKNIKYFDKLLSKKFIKHYFRN